MTFKMLQEYLCLKEGGVFICYPEAAYYRPKANNAPAFPWVRKSVIEEQGARVGSRCYFARAGDVLCATTSDKGLR